MKKAKLGKLWMSIACAMLSLCLVVPFAACAQDGETDTEQKITLNPTTVSVEEGKEATLTATLTGISGDVTWTVDKADVATVAVKNAAATTKVATVTGVAEGTATVTATAGGKSATCAVTVTAKPEDEEPGEDGPGEDGPVERPQPTNVANGAENQYETGWRYWSGDGDAVVSSCINYSDNNEVQITYTMSNGQWYSVQLFYKDKYAGTDHNVSLTVDSPIAASITINGQVNELAVGENSVTVENFTGSTLSVQFGVDGKSIVSGTDLKFIFKDLVVTSNATTELKAPSFEYDAASKVITITDTENQSSDVEKYELGLFNAATDTDPAYKLEVTGGSAINLSTIPTGTYILKLRAVNSSATVVSSPWSTATATLEWSNEKTPLQYSEEGPIPEESKTWYYWNQTWDAICSFDACYIDATGIHIEGLKGNVGNTWSFQLFYKGTFSSCTMTITSSTAGIITINGVEETLEANTPKQVTIAGSSKIGMQFGPNVTGDKTKNLSGNISLTDISFS